MNKRVYVIIVTWNGMKWIGKCLEALQHSTYPVTTILIDNLSTDETVEFVKRNYPLVNIIQSDHNLGFGQANNIGMRIALKEQADYVYLLNQDAYVYPDMFSNLLKVAETNGSEYAIFSPLHLKPCGTSFDSHFKDYFKECATGIAEDFLCFNIKNIYDVSCVPAAGWLLPINTLKNVGGFDPIYFHYGEDIHYTQRIIFHGYKIGIVPSAKMVHDRVEFGNMDAFKRGEILRTQEVYGLLNVNLTTSQRWSFFLKSYLYLWGTERSV